MSRGLRSAIYQKFLLCDRVILVITPGGSSGPAPKFEGFEDLFHAHCMNVEHHIVYGKDRDEILHQ